MANEGRWCVVVVLGGRASSAVAVPSRAEAVEAARLVAERQGAKGWCVLKPAPGCCVLHGPEAGGWAVLLYPAAPVVADAPKRKARSRAVAAPPAAAGAALAVH